MKATQKDFARVAPQAAAQARVFFFCGPDEAGAHDAATRIAGLIDNPGERVEFTGAELRRDPVRLGDETRSVSLFGDSRHIWVRAQGDDAAEAVEIMLAGEVRPCPVLIVAVGATDKSRTAKLLADRPDALVAMFWPPDVGAVTGSVRSMAEHAGLRMDGALAERIARAAGLDTRLAQSEVTKLALYLDAAPESPRKADAAALDAVGAKTEEDGLAPLVNVVLAGDAGKLSAELRRMRELGLNPVAIVLALERRVAQLAQLAGQLGPRGEIQALLDADRRVFWKDKRDLAVQLRRWRGRRLERLIARLSALHRSLLTNSQGAELLLSQELASIVRVAGSAN